MISSSPTIRTHCIGNGEEDRRGRLSYGKEHGDTGSGRSPRPALRRGASGRHRRLRRGRRAAAGRRLHRHAGPQDRLELAAGRARHRRHGHGHRLRRRPAGGRDPVLRLRLQHHRPAQGGRQPALGQQRQLRHAHRRHDADRLRHPRQPVPLALLRELGQPPGRLEGRHAEQPARRLRADAVGHRRPQPGARPAAQGAAARQG